MIASMDLCGWEVGRVRVWCIDILCFAQLLVDEPDAEEGGVVRAGGSWNCGWWEREEWNLEMVMCAHNKKYKNVSSPKWRLPNRESPISFCATALASLTISPLF